MKLRIFGTAGRVQTDDDTHIPRAWVDGIDDDSNFIEYMDSIIETYFVEGSEAHMKFSYTDEYDGHADLYVEIDYDVIGTLSPYELKKVIDYTSGQLSDGIGESFEQHPCTNINGYDIYVSPWHRDQKLRFKFIDNV